MPPKVKKSVQTKKPLQVADVPFYQAVDFFEKNMIGDALPIFIDCARQGNLYASHYINHILLKMPMVLEGLTLTPEQRGFIEPQHFNSYFAALPNNFMPQAWFETSLIKREFSEKIWFEKSEKQKIVHLSKLIELAGWCGNAYVYLSTLIRTNREIADLIEKNRKTINFDNLVNPQLIDLFMVIHDELYAQVPPTKSHPRVKALWFTIDKQALVAEQKVATEYAIVAKTGGKLEELIYKKLYDPLYDSSSKKPSDPPQHKKAADVPKLKRLRKWHLTAANMGNNYVQWLMAVRLPYGQSKVDKDKWLAIAARHGDIAAQLVVGINCLTQKDWEKAFNMLEVIPADLNISKLQGNKRIPESLLKQAIYTKGSLFENGPQTHRDEEEALRHYQLATTLSFPGAFRNVAVYYEQGRGGLEKDYKKAIEYFSSCYALDENELVALEYIANLYFQGGFGIHRDYHQAEDYYRKYLKTGATFTSAGSYGNLANIIFSKDNPKHYEQASSYCKQALKMDPGNDHVRRVLIYNYCLGKISKSPDINDDTIDTMVQAVFVKCPEVLNNLVEYYYSGKGNSKKNSKKMVKFARLGHKNNLDYCTAVLGYCYEHGVKDADVEQDDSQAVLYYKKAANTYSYAACNLGFLLLLKESRGEKSDLKQAKEYLELALKGGSLMAAYNLWNWYIDHGGKVLEIGQPEAEEKGFAVLIQAEELEDADVQYSIGYAYHVGMGCKKDWPQALHFYEKAIRLGSGPACVNNASLIFASCLKEDGIDYATLERCIELSEKSVELSGRFFLGGQFFLGMFQMILDPNQKNKVVRNWKELLKHQKDIIESEDNKAFSDRMGYILKLMEAEKGQPSRLKVILWFSTKVVDLKSLREELRICLAKEKVGGMMEARGLSDQDNQIDHLLTRINKFTSLSPGKVDFGGFRELVNEVVSSNLGLVSFSMRHSKSSNVQMRFLVEGSEKPITLSHHKARFQDPGRGKSMQRVMSAIAQDLVAMQQETSKNLDSPFLEEAESRIPRGHDVKREAEDQEFLMVVEASMRDNSVPDEPVSPKIKPPSQDISQQIPSEPPVEPLIFSGEQTTKKKKQSLLNPEPKGKLTKEEWEAILSVTWALIKPGTVETTEGMTYIEADNLKEKLVKAGLNGEGMTVTRDLRSSKYQLEIPQQEQEKLDRLYRESTVGQRVQMG